MSHTSRCCLRWSLLALRLLLHELKFLNQKGKKWTMEHRIKQLVRNPVALFVVHSHVHSDTKPTNNRNKGHEIIKDENK